MRIGGRAEREDRKNRTPYWENHFSCHNSALSCACIYTCIVVKYCRRANLIFTVEARMISLQARVAIVFKLNNPSLHTCVCLHSSIHTAPVPPLYFSPDMTHSAVISPACSSTQPLWPLSSLGLNQDTIVAEYLECDMHK